MNLQELGKKFIVEVSSTRISAEERTLIKDLRPAGFMFRKRNFLQGVTYETWIAEYRELIHELRSTLPNQKLILSIDHEGGLIIRPPLPITRFPYPFYWHDKTATVSKAMALELKSLAINLNFAPVADIHSNPENPVINDRAFACSPLGVINKMLVFIAEMKKMKISCCAKHYPGHGNTTADSHLHLPSLDSTLEELENCELQPFQAAINHSIPTVMPGHLYFPKIDPDNFVTFSNFFLTILLRKKMGFKGVTIADAFSMAPAKEQLFKPEMIARACNAGLDIFSIVGQGLEIKDAIIVRDLLHQGIKEKEVNLNSLESSLQRIQSFMNGLSTFEVSILKQSILERHSRIAEKLSPKEKDRLENIIVTK